MVKTPLKLVLLVVPGGTPWIKTEPGLPGLSESVWPVGTVTVTVTSPELSDMPEIANDEDDFVTSTPFTKPSPPGVTKARWECGTMAICGLAPVFSVSCECTQGAVVAEGEPGRQGSESALRSSKNPTLAVVGLALEVNATIALLVSESTPTEYGSGSGVTFDGINPASEMVLG